MSETKSYGFTSWDDSTKGGPANRSREELPKFEYMRLVDGNNNLRIITRPARFYMVRFKAHPNEKGFGKRVNTAWPAHEDCPAKTAGLKPKERFLVGVIDRNDQKVKILDMSVLVYEQVQNLKNDIEWGEPTGYDVNIRKNSKAKTPAAFYNVLPRSKAQLSQADEAMVAECKEGLEKVLTLRTTPPKPETVRKRMVDLGWDGRAMVTAAVEGGDTELAESDDDTAYEFKRPSAQA